MRKKDILLAEDEASIVVSIKHRLELEHEFVVQVVSNGSDVLRSISASPPDALVMDTSLRDMPAANICRLVRLRERTARMPVILLGTRDVGPDLVEGLALGADDYVPKPFELAELEARLRAVLRRHVHEPREHPESFKGARLEANFSDVAVTVDGVPVSLTKREFQLLRALVRHQNDVVGREQLLTDVWGADGWDLRIVDSAMWKLRKKLGGAGRQIETITGFGYRFNEPSKH